MMFLQKYLIQILLGVLGLLFIIAGVQYVRFLKIDSLYKQQLQTIEAMKVSLKAYEENNAVMKKTEVRQQEIKNMLSKFDKHISGLSTGKCMEEKDEKFFTDIFTSFNDGLSQGSSSSSSK